MQTSISAPVSKSSSNWSAQVSVTFTATTFPLFSERAEKMFPDRKKVEREQFRAAFEEELEAYRKACPEDGSYTMLTLAFQKK